MSIESRSSGAPDLSFMIEAFDAPPHPHALAGVLFAEEFDLADMPPRAPTPTTPAVTAADLHAARDHGYRDGHSAAQAEHAAACRELASTALATVSRSLADMHAAHAAIVTAACADTAAALLGLLAAALPTLCAEHGPAEAAALAAALLPLLAQQPRVAIRANPHTLSVLRDALSATLNEQPDRVCLIATDALDEGDVSIDWQDGSAHRDMRALRRALHDALTPLGLALGGDALARQPAAQEPELVE